MSRRWRGLETLQQLDFAAGRQDLPGRMQACWNNWADRSLDASRVSVSGLDPALLKKLGRTIGPPGGWPRRA